MFTWLTERLNAFSQWWKGLKRRRTYRKKRAPVVSVPIPHEKIGRVRGGGRYRTREGEARLIKSLMIGTLAVIGVLLVIVLIIVSNRVNSSDEVKWDTLDEFMGVQSEAQEQEAELPVSVSDKVPDASLLITASEDEPLPQGWKPALSAIDGVSADSRLCAAFAEMREAMAEKGLTLTVVSGYTAFEEQEEIYQQKLSGFYAQGYSKVRAEAAAAPYKSGCNEQQTGLLIKVALPNGGSFEESEACSWLEIYGVDYGFVFRYTDEKEHVTGFAEDLSYLRYVGEEHAPQMRRLEMCLEEYREYVSER